jgi:hypothetical protein
MADDLWVRLDPAESDTNWFDEEDGGVSGLRRDELAIRSAFMLENYYGYQFYGSPLSSEVMMTDEQIRQSFELILPRLIDDDEVERRPAAKMSM